MKLLFVYGEPDNGFGALFGEQDFLYESSRKPKIIMERS